MFLMRLLPNGEGRTGGMFTMGGAVPNLKGAGFYGRDRPEDIAQLVSTPRLLSECKSSAHWWRSAWSFMGLFSGQNSFRDADIFASGSLTPYDASPNPAEECWWKTVGGPLGRIMEGQPHVLGQPVEGSQPYNVQAGCCDISASRTATPNGGGCPWMYIYIGAGVALVVIAGLLYLLFGGGGCECCPPGYIPVEIRECCGRSREMVDSEETPNTPAQRVSSWASASSATTSDKSERSRVTAGMFGEAEKSESDSEEVDTGESSGSVVEIQI